MKIHFGALCALSLGASVAVGQDTGEFNKHGPSEVQSGPVEAFDGIKPEGWPFPFNDHFSFGPPGDPGRPFGEGLAVYNDPVPPPWGERLAVYNDPVPPPHLAGIPWRFDRGRRLAEAMQCPTCGTVIHA